MSHKSNFSTTLIVILLMGLLLMIVSSASAQLPTGWSDPQLLYRSDYSVTNPLVVGDSLGNVHVLWIENDTQGSIIPTVFHMEKRDSEWSKPESILVSPQGGSINGLNVAADSTGRLHTIWQGPNNSLYYSSAYVEQAIDPKNWSKPIILASSFTFPGITVDQTGGVYIAYPSASTDSINMLISRDGGKSWDMPDLVNVAYSSDGGINYTPVVVSPDGTIYVAWSEFRLPDGWPPLGVYVSRSIDNGLTWSSPVELAGEGYDQINLAIRQDGEVYAFWNGMIGIGGRYVSSSRDEGDNWSTPIAVIPPGLGGTSGYLHLVFDSLNNAHLITSVDSQGGLQYIKQIESNWSPREAISTAIDYEAYTIRSLELPWACASQGNHIHVVYEVGFVEIYYQERMLEAPALPIPTHMTEQSKPTEPAQDLPLLEPTAVTLENQLAGIQPAYSNNVSRPMVLAAVCVIALILMGFLVRKWRLK